MLLELKFFTLGVFNWFRQLTEVISVGSVESVIVILALLVGFLGYMYYRSQFGDNSTNSVLSRREKELLEKLEQKDKKIEELNNKIISLLRDQQEILTDITNKYNSNLLDLEKSFSRIEILLSEVKSIININRSN